MTDAATALDRPAVLAVDLGTSGTRAALVRLDGEVLGSARTLHPTQTPEDGGVEQSPDDWLVSARSAIAMCLARAGAGELPPIAALSLTGQMQDLVLLGDTDGGRGFLAPAVLYSDTRAAEDATAIREALPAWDEVTGNPQGATSVAAMWRRAQRTTPDAVRAADDMVFGPSEFLAWALTGDAWCDVTTASATGLMDLGTRQWSAEVCEAAGISLDSMPRIADGPLLGTVVGETNRGAADLVGLPDGIPIVLAPGDAAATTLGVVGLEPGEGYAYLGSSGWLARVLEHPLPSPEGGVVHRLALPRRDELDAEAPVLRISPLLAAGAAAAWAREAFLGGASPEEADSLLAEREAERGRGPSGLLALPSIRGERFPVHADELRAAVVGMTEGARGIDVYAAILEGVAHAIAHALPGEGIDVLPVSGGGAVSAPWRRILADVTGVPVVALDAADAPLVGAAIAGAEAIGAEHEIRPLWVRGLGETIEPDAEAARAYANERDAHRALYGALAEIERLRGRGGQES